MSLQKVRSDLEKRLKKEKAELEKLNTKLLKEFKNLRKSEGERKAVWFRHIQTLNNLWDVDRQLEKIDKFKEETKLKGGSKKRSVKKRSVKKRSVKKPNNKSKKDFDKKTAKFPRKMSKKYCLKTSCEHMGFSQKASCRYYKNCYSK